MSIEIAANTTGRTFTAPSVQLRKQSSETAQTPQRSDSVSVSRDALLLQEAKRTAQAAPDVRSDVVASLREQIQNGTYAMDSAEIASHLLAEEPGLFV